MNTTAKPILFSTPMVSAILENRKSQTRRIIKIPDLIANPNHFRYAGNDLTRGDTPRPAIKYDDRLYHVFELKNNNGPMWVEPSKYKPGNILYVRETYFIHPTENTIHYKTDDKIEWAMWGLDPVECKWKPSLFMPKAAARIFLEVTEVRAERLQDITEQDALAEGYPFPNIAKETEPKQWFETLWQSINKEWNPEQWVWVYEFKKIDKP
jgi:hypothetical protein